MTHPTDSLLKRDEQAPDFRRWQLKLSDFHRDSLCMTLLNRLHKQVGSGRHTDYESTFLPWIWTAREGEHRGPRLLQS